MGDETRTKWVFEFSEGSRDMRDLLGGKGANVAEMTRVLGAERVPAGFTITTEACVAYMRAGHVEPDGLEEQVRAALERLEETMDEAKAASGAAADTDLGTEQLQALTGRFREIFEEEAGAPFPQDP